jgi:hypothetical protein
MNVLTPTSRACLSDCFSLNARMNCSMRDTESSLDATIPSILSRFYAQVTREQWGKTWSGRSVALCAYRSAHIQDQSWQPQALSSGGNIAVFSVWTNRFVVNEYDQADTQCRLAGCIFIWAWHRVFARIFKIQLACCVRESVMGRSASRQVGCPCRERKVHKLADQGERKYLGRH